MNRRRFTRLSATTLAGLSVPGMLRNRSRERRVEVGARTPGSTHRDSITSPGPTPELRVDGPRLNGRLAELARFGANADGGIDRVAFSDADLEARAWIRGLMREAGLDPSVDAAGNMWGRRAGTDPSLPPLMLGSHIDSVPGGGNYDGQVGSLGAVEVAATLADAKYSPHHPLEFVIFSNEEGGKTGSRALAGEVRSDELDLTTAGGFTIGEGLRRIGGDPDRLAGLRRTPGSATAYFELHIEQGFVLDRAGVDIGVVQGIVGIRRWNVTVEGFANHAGTTPMDQRHDAMVGAARFVDGVYRTVRSIPGTQVATVGRIRAEPGAPNVIPGRVTLSLEIRDLAMDKIDRVYAVLENLAAGVGTETGTTFAFDPFYLSRAAPTDPRLRDVVEAQARRLGLTTRRMPSGAGHDAQSIARFAPVGMIFVPSRDGVSHSPLEFTEPEQVTAGADVLLRSVLAVDQAGLG